MGVKDLKTRKVINYYFNSSLLKRLLKYSEKTYIPQTSIIDLSVEEYLNNHCGEVPEYSSVRAHLENPERNMDANLTDRKKRNFSINIGLLARLDEYSKKTRVPKTRILDMALREYLDASGELEERTQSH